MIIPIGITGHELEVLICGRASSLKGKMRCKRLRVEEAFIYAKRHLPKGWSPYRPSTELGRLMRKHVANQLPKGERELRLFSSTDTSLDYHYGVDLFFDYRSVVLCLDLKLRNRAIESNRYVLVATAFRTGEIYATLDFIARTLRRRDHAQFEEVAHQNRLRRESA